MQVYKIQKYIQICKSCFYKYFEKDVQTSRLSRDAPLCNGDVNITTTLHVVSSKIVKKELIVPSRLIVLSYILTSYIIRNVKFLANVNAIVKPQKRN